MRAIFLGCAIGLLAASCATAPPLAGPDPSFVEPAPASRGGFALALSGGAARGYAHVGVIKVLEAHGLRPDLVVGTSAGSIVGSLYASGLSAAELERAVGELGRFDFADLALPGLGLLPGAMGLTKGDGLHRFIDQRARHHRIEAFPIRFAAVATDLATGEPQIFNAGDVGMAVRASSAAPGVVEPMSVGARKFVDGQLSSPIPVSAARRLGARVVVAVDVVYPPEEALPRTAVGVLFQAFVIMAHRLKAHEAADADLVIAPRLPRTSGQLSFSDRERLIEAGERAALESLAPLKALIAERVRSR